MEATDFGGNPPYQKRLSQYAEKYSNNSEAKDAVKLYRTLLSHANEPVELIETGYLQVLTALLQSETDEISPLSGMALVREKVSKLWMMAGKRDQNPGTENNFARNTHSRRAAYILCEVCPIPIIFLGWEVGAPVISGINLEKTDPLYLVFVITVLPTDAPPGILCCVYSR